MRPIPNTIDATTGTEAIKAPIQTSVEGPPTGQQRLQPPINQTGHQMDAPCLWIPGKIDVAQGHKGKQLCGLDNAYGTQRPKILPQSNQDG